MIHFLSVDKTEKRTVKNGEMAKMNTAPLHTSKFVDQYSKFIGQWPMSPPDPPWFASTLANPQVKT